MKRKRFKNTLIIIIASICMLVAVTPMMTAYAGTYADNFKHSSDTVNLLNNHITYTYNSYKNNSYVGTSTTDYAVQNNWADKMKVAFHQAGSMPGVSGEFKGTVLYGPYIWLPKGDYKITFTFKDYDKYHTWCGQDAGSSLGPGGGGNTGYMFWGCIGETFRISDTAYVDQTGYNRDSLSYYYTLHTDGETADYEFRTFFNTEEYKNYSYSDIIESLTIEADYSNTLTYNTNGGAMSNGATTGRFGTTFWGKKRDNVNSSVGTPTRAGYTFDGWGTYTTATNYTTNRDGLTFDTSSGLTKIYNADGTPCWNVTTESCYTGYKVYAMWTPNDYTLYFNGNGGTVPWKSDQSSGNDNERWVSVKYDSTAYNTRQDAIPTRDGYVFEGWYTEANGGRQVYDSAGIANTSESGCWQKVTIDDVEYTVWKSTTDYRVYAHWKHADIFVSYKNMNGVNSDDDYFISRPATVIQNSYYDNNTVPRTGFEFIGYNSKADGSGTSYNPGDKIQTIYGGTTIKNKTNMNLCIDNANFMFNDGNNIGVSHCSSNSAQVWAFVYDHDENGQAWWSIRNVANGKCLDVGDINHPGYDANVYLWRSVLDGSGYEHAQHLFTVEMASDGYFYIKNKANGHYITMENGNVVTRQFNGGDNQQWAIDEIDVRRYAQWKSKTFILTVQYDDGVSSVSGAGTYTYGTTANVLAEIKTGYTFDYIEDIDNGTKLDTNPCSLPINGNRNVYIHTKANKYQIFFDSNGGTGSMQPLLALYDIPIPLTKNTFTKTTDSGQSTFLYWEDRENNKIYEDEANVVNLTSADNDSITLYAIWDNCPDITAQDRYFTVDDAKNGKITLDELLSTATVIDDRDSDIQDRLTVKYYDANIYTQFRSDGAVFVVYTANDSSGNVTEVTAKINIVDTTAVENVKTSYVRSISPKYYKETPENGGLELNSVWKLNPEYAAVLEQAMINRDSLQYETADETFLGVSLSIKQDGSISRDHIVEEWVFTASDVNAAKEYINLHGVGKLKEENGLQNFRSQFINCKKA